MNPGTTLIRCRLCRTTSTGSPCIVPHLRAATSHRQKEKTGSNLGIVYDLTCLPHCQNPSPALRSYPKRNESDCRRAPHTPTALQLAVGGRSVPQIVGRRPRKSEPPGDCR